MDKNKIFLINRGELEGRLDIVYYKLQNNCDITYKKLSNYLIDIFQGQSQGSYEKDNIKVLKVRNLDLFGNLDLKDVTFVNEVNSRKILQKGDILTPFRGQTIFTNKFVLFDSDEIATIDNNLGVIRLNPEKIIPKFFRYYISSKIGFNEILKNVGGASIPALTKDIIGNIKVPTLSFNIQQNIIDMMDRAYESKKQKEKEAQDLLDSIDDYLFDKLGIKLPNEPENNIENRTFKVRFNDIFADRLDAD